MRGGQGLESNYTAECASALKRASSWNENYFTA